MSENRIEKGENADWFNLSSGSYTVQIQDANGCLLKEDIMINDPTLVAVDLGPDRNIDFGESITLTPSLSIQPIYINALVTYAQFYS